MVFCTLSRVSILCLIFLSCHVTHFTCFQLSYSKISLNSFKSTSITTSSINWNLHAVDVKSTQSLSEESTDVRENPNTISFLSKISSDPWAARTALLIVSALYGSNFGCVKILNQSMDPSLGAFMRFTLAGMIFFPNFISYIFSKKDKSLLINGFEVGTYCFLGYWAQANALDQDSSASNTAFICSLAVVVVPILDIIFKSTKPKDIYSMIQSVVPAILALCGVGFLEFGDERLASFSDLLACLQPLFFGLSFWRIESYINKAKQAGDSQSFTGSMLFTVAFLSLVWVVSDFSLFTMNGHVNSSAFANLLSQLHTMHDSTVLAAILWTGIFTTALTTYVENIAMKMLSGK